MLNQLPDGIVLEMIDDFNHLASRIDDGRIPKKCLEEDVTDELLFDYVMLNENLLYMVVDAYKKMPQEDRNYLLLAYNEIERDSLPVEFNTRATAALEMAKARKHVHKEHIEDLIMALEYAKYGIDSLGGVSLHRDMIFEDIIAGEQESIDEQKEGEEPPKRYDE